MEQIEYILACSHSLRTQTYFWLSFRIPSAERDDGEKRIAGYTSAFASYMRWGNGKFDLLFLATEADNQLVFKNQANQIAKS